MRPSSASSDKQIEQLEEADLRGQGREGRQPPHRQGTGEGQEAPHHQAEGARRPRAQGRCHHASSSWASTGFSSMRRDLLQESRIRDQDEPHRRPAQYREQPRARHVHEDALSRRARRRHRLCHRHADLEHHGRDVHAAALPRAGDRSKRRASSISTPGPPISARPSPRWNSPRTARATACTRDLRNSSTCRSCSRCSAASPTCRPPTCCICPVPTSRAASRISPPLRHRRSLKAYVRTLVERAQKLRTAAIDPTIDNMLKITGDGRKAALDMRLVDPVRRDPRRYEGKPRRREHLPHLGRRTGTGARPSLSSATSRRPIPTSSTSMTKSATSSSPKASRRRKSPISTTPRPTSRRRALFDSVNAGRIRILLGSTEKMGAGTNVQKRLIALHHLDAPWRPRDIEQREGRILRQGNDNPTVHIHRYVTEGSFDAYMWQTLETKARFINQVMNGSVTVRQAEDLEGGALTYRRNQGHRVGQSRRDGKGQGRYRNPQARPAPLLPHQPAAQYPLAGEKPARADRTRPEIPCRRLRRYRAPAMRMPTRTSR